MSDLAKAILGELDSSHRLVVWGTSSPRYSALVEELKQVFDQPRNVKIKSFDFFELMAMPRSKLIGETRTELLELEDMFVYNFDVCGEGVDFYRATDVMTTLRACNNENLGQHNLLLARPEANLNYWKPVVSGPPKESHPSYTGNHPLGNWVIFKHVNGESLDYQSI